MKPVWKYTIVSVCTLLIVVYIVVALQLSHRMMPRPVCQHLIVRIQDSAERQLVSVPELTDMLTSSKLNPIGCAADQIDLLGIEQLISSNEMVRTAECYCTMRGDVVVKVSQRIPLFHVLTECETYYIDTDRKMMPPVAEVVTPFMVIGKVSHRMAREELYDFALWLQEHPYWGEYITGIDVVSPRCVELTDQRHHAYIRLGSWQGFERKLNKLQHFYEAGKDLNIEQYSCLDIQYHGQVIGVKNQ